MPPRRGGSKLHNRAAHRLRAGRRAEADGHGRTRGRIPGAGVSQSIPPVGGYTRSADRLPLRLPVYQRVG